MPRKRSDRMLVGTIRALQKSVPRLLDFYGFKLTDSDYGTYLTTETSFGCEFTCSPILGPAYVPYACWVPGRFRRDPLYTPWTQGDPRNRLYDDIRKSLADSVNPFTGKYNWHCFERMTEQEALSSLEGHIRAIFPAGFRSGWFS